jgi:hypothetical protein
MRFFLSVAISILIASTASSAQLCGSFGIKLDIHDTALKPVKGVKIKIVEPATKLEGGEYLRPEQQFEAVPGRPGQWQISLGEGLEAAEGYGIEITAKDFVKQERPITFPHCKRIEYDITMLKPNENAGLLTGKVIDETGDPVPYAEMTFYDSEGLRRNINADPNGRYEIKLKPGTYRIESELEYFHMTRVKKLIVAAGAAGTAALDIKMKSLGGSEYNTVIEQ